MNAPVDLIEALVQQLGHAPRDVGIMRSDAVPGMIRCTIDEQPCLIKWSNERPPEPWPDRCTAEAADLQLLASVGALRVPRVLAHAAAEGDRPAFLVMEWISSVPSNQRAHEQLGHALAALHGSTAATYGLDRHNYCGATPQPNTPHDSWIDFYARQRLGWQHDLAVRNQRMPAPRRDRLERLIERLGDWIDERSVQPSLLHGDLWGGNWLIDPEGAPVLIDPAAYYGDREAELAMCRLFGGFSSAFFAAYDEAWPPAPGRDERIQLYQLYHLLNHLNIFGESYGAQVDRVLRRYVG